MKTPGKRRFLMLFAVQAVLLLLAAGGAAFALERQPSGNRSVTLDTGTFRPEALLQSLPEVGLAKVGQAGLRTFQIDTGGLFLTHLSLALSYPTALLSIQTVASPDPTCQRTLAHTQAAGTLRITCDLDRPARQNQIIPVIELGYLPLAPGSAIVRLVDEGSSATTADGRGVSLVPQNGIISITP